MIQVEEALRIIANNAITGQTELIPIKEGLGRHLSSPIQSPIDFPPFAQSAMDGYAIGKGKTEFQISSITAAGDTERKNILDHHCIRIFTGAAVPEGTQFIAPQEDVTVSGNTIKLNKEFSDYANIRPQGEQIKKGEIALQRSEILNAGSIGYLTGLGITHVEVFKRPIIHVLVTGDELIKPGQHLEYGKIYESNSIMLEMALSELGFSVELLEYIPDNFEATKNKIQKSLASCDFLFLSGGISVGDFDFVGKSLRELGVEEAFYKVNQKPGKPLFYGKHNKCQVFALPGNPAAALSCFYIYASPALNFFSSNQFSGLKKALVPLKEEYYKKGSRAQFLKARVSEGEVEILGQQSSASLQVFPTTNALAYIPSEKEFSQKGESILVYQLPLCQ